ncbi:MULTISPECIES: Ppx/GppA phosphatase family protein [unclassified Streptomyces]|uniref:Ppx/GppA phosphatase family protein n=1 Tax=unclassified Streptomyces TaxID=2593676 RepID=UPI00336A1B53
MRLGVLDIGSQSAHLDIADLTAGGPPEPVASLKRPVRLAEATDRQGVIEQEAIKRVVAAVTEAVAVAEAHGVETLVAFATSAIRDAANRPVVVAEVEDATGIRLTFMTGEEEARLTYLAARGWYGWSAGEMLLLDIGGGSLEIACGSRAEPAVALSVPLGAGRLTRHHLPATGPVTKADVKALRQFVRSVMSETAEGLRDRPEPRTRVGSSRTFAQLARLTGAPKAKAGPYAERVLDRDRLAAWVPRLAARSPAERARLPGISAARAHQALAGAVVAEAAMDVLGIDRLRICPWALREGVLLDRLRTLEAQSVPGPSCEVSPGPSREVPAAPASASVVALPAGRGRYGPGRLHTVTFPWA